MRSAKYETEIEKLLGELLAWVKRNAQADRRCLPSTRKVMPETILRIRQLRGIIEARRMAPYWFRIFDGNTLDHICDVGTQESAPHCYDPRIGGSGEVIWQGPYTPAEAQEWIGGAR